MKAQFVGRTNAQPTDDFDSRNDRYLTPLSLIDALGTFDLDPCGAPGHPTARVVWTPETHGDGLSMPWRGRVWLNPPYGRTMAAWVEALADHGTGTALTFARTETRLFQRCVLPRASALLLLSGRVSFLNPQREQLRPAPGSPVLIAFGDDDAQALATTKLAGFFVELRGTPAFGSTDQSPPESEGER